MKKTLICSALAFLGIGNHVAKAQVQDVSVTFSPTASYNWFDKNTSIKDGLLVGGRVGFGFGQNFELRATYEKSVDLKNEIDKIDALSQEYKDKFEGRKVNVERWGGEMKANIPTNGTFAPYLTLGAGVQTLSLEDMKDQKQQQIFLTGGIGTKISLSDRVVLNLEGKNTAFNLDKASIIYDPSEDGQKEDQEYINNSKEERMYNWSVLAGLQFYLGGRSPEELTELDRAYLQKFSGGLSGFKFVIEPGGAYVDFNKDLQLRDTYLVGGSAGFDLNQYIGLRGFYYQATQNKQFKKFDDLAMYGGEVNAKLNVARGITPYITLGGGFINAYEASYVGENGTTGKYNSYFVKGGAGVVVPVAKYFDLFGAANLLYTTNKQADKLARLQNPEELKQSTMYNVGVRFKFGADPESTILKHKLNSTDSSYNERIAELEAQLKEAYENNDSDKALRTIKEKQRLEKGYDYRVRMTPEELEKLIEKTIDEVDAEYNQKSSQERIDRLESALLQINSANVAPQSSNVNDVNNKILSELKVLNAKVDNNAKQISMINGSSDKTVVINPNGATTTDAQTVTTTTAPTVTSNDEGQPAVAKSIFLYEGISLEGGVAFGGGTAGTFGVRGHYGFTNSNFEFQPSVFVGFGGDNGLGINANAIYKFDYENKAVVKPYLGVGVGYNKVGDADGFGANLVVGTSFNVLNGNLYVDYSALNLFDINKVSVGYKFGF